MDSTEILQSPSRESQSTESRSVEPEPRGRVKRVGIVVLRIVGLLAALVLVRTVGLAVCSGLALPVFVADVATAGLVLCGYVGLVRWWEKRRATELTRELAPRQLVSGAVLGLALCAIAVAVIAMFGMYHIDAFNGLGALWSVLGTSALAAVFEELLFRGVLLRILAEKLGNRWALGISSAVFGVSHLLNGHATLTSTVAIAVEAGVLLGTVYLCTRSIWPAIGLHFAWNASESGLFGVPVSGIDFDGLVQAHLTGPGVFSGGAFGLEGSLITIVVCLAAAITLVRLTRRNSPMLERFLRPRKG